MLSMAIPLTMRHILLRQAAPVLGSVGIIPHAISRLNHIAQVSVWQEDLTENIYVEHYGSEWTLQPFVHFGSPFPGY